jgi:hypothetical protein
LLPILNVWLFSASSLRSAAVAVIEPVVISSESMNESRPVRIVATDQAGFHVDGWNDVIDVQILVSGLNRPDGVKSLMSGGLKG